MDIYVKYVMPSYMGNYSAAVAVMYRGTFGTPKEVSFTPQQLGLAHEGGYIVSEVFDDAPMGTFMLQDSITVKVNPNGEQKMSAHSQIYNILLTPKLA